MLERFKCYCGQKIPTRGSATVSVASVGVSPTEQATYLQTCLKLGKSVWRDARRGGRDDRAPLRLSKLTGFSFL
jgi:hypothetical protein